jgi:mutator protein MutT
MQRIEVSAGLVFRNGKLLITQRPAGAHLEGLWEFPGGKREADESFEACLIRELREELGIEVSVRELVEEIEHDYAGKRVLLKFYRCEWLANEPQALGCPAFKWIEKGELVTHAFPAADARLIDRLQRKSMVWAKS